MSFLNWNHAPLFQYRKFSGISRGDDFLTPQPPSLCCRSVYNFFIAVAALEEPPNRCGGDAPVASEKEVKPRPPGPESQDADTHSCSSAALDEPRERREPADTDSGSGNAESSSAVAPAAVEPAAVPAAAPAGLGAAVGFVGAFGGGVEKEQHPTGVRFGLGLGAGSAGSATDSSFTSSVRGSFTSSISSRSSSSSSSVGPVTAGDIAAATAGPDGNRSVGQDDRRAEDGVAPLPLVPSVLSSQTPGTAPGLSDWDGNGNEGLEMLQTSELESAEVAGILDAVDELLGEGDLEGFGEAGTEEGMLPFAEGDA